MRTKIASRSLHDNRCTAGIHLMSGEIGKIIHHSLVDEFGATRPIAFNIELA